LSGLLGVHRSRFGSENHLSVPGNARGCPRCFSAGNEECTFPSFCKTRPRLSPQTLGGCPLEHDTPPMLFTSRALSWVMEPRGLAFARKTCAGRPLSASCPNDFLAILELLMRMVIALARFASRFLDLLQFLAQLPRALSRQDVSAISLLRFEEVQQLLRAHCSQALSRISVLPILFFVCDSNPGPSQRIARRRSIASRNVIASYFGVAVFVDGFEPAF